MSIMKTKYKSFHGREPGRFLYSQFYIPRSLIYLGRAVSITYESDKKHGGGDGYPCNYIHKFTTPVDLYMDERGRVQLYLIGRSLKVTSRGIEN